jgi:hypothetical protein
MSSKRQYVVQVKITVPDNRARIRAVQRHQLHPYFNSGMPFVQGHIGHFRAPAGDGVAAGGAGLDEVVLIMQMLGE